PPRVSWQSPLGSGCLRCWRHKGPRADSLPGKSVRFKGWLKKISPKITGQSRCCGCPSRAGRRRGEAGGVPRRLMTISRSSASRIIGAGNPEKRRVGPGATRFPCFHPQVEVCLARLMNGRGHIVPGTPVTNTPVTPDETTDFLLEWYKLHRSHELELNKA